MIKYIPSQCVRAFFDLALITERVVAARTCWDILGK